MAMCPLIVFEAAKVIEIFGTVEPKHCQRQKGPRDEFFYLSVSTQSTIQS